MGEAVLPGSETKLKEGDFVASSLADFSSGKGDFLQKVVEFDKQLSLRVHGGGVVPRWVLKLLEFSGDGLLWIPLTAAVWLAPILLEKDALRSFLFNMFVAFVFDLVVNGVIKEVVRRPRPVYNKGMYMVLSVDHWSFPSGHSSRALMIAAFFSLHLSMVKGLLASRASVWEGSLQSVGGFGIEGYVPAVEVCLAIGLWSWALATATSRILLGRHYVFDVLFGSLLGILEALFVHRMLFVSPHLSRGIHDSVMGVFRQA